MQQGLFITEEPEMLTRVVLVACIVCAAAAAMAAEDRATIELEGRYWMPDLSTSGRFVDEGNLGTDIDFKDDLGLSDKNFPQARITLNLGENHRLRASYTPISYSGDHNLIKTIIFSDTTYNIGTRVITDLDIQYITLGWAWQFVNIGNGTLKLGPVVDLKGFIFDASLQAPALGVDESAGAPAGFPTIGLALDVNPRDKVNIFAEVTGVYAGKYGYFADGEAGLKLIPIKNLSISGGYKILKLDAEYEESFLKLRIGGPFVGAALRF